MGIYERMSHLDEATVVRYERVIKRYGIKEETTWVDIKKEVEKVRNPNTRRSEIGALTTILGTKEGRPKPPKPQPKIYELPSKEDITKFEDSPYGAYIFAMAFAGLRVGEAVALQPEDVKKLGGKFFIDVMYSKQHTGRIKEPKSGTGRVLIPEWLYDYLKGADYPEILPNSLFKWMKRRGLTPHQLRHYYATFLVRKTANPELVRRQLRHSNLSTTLSIYAQVETEDESALLEAL